MATKPKKPPRKRPGAPRKREKLDRITLRIGRPLAIEMLRACDAQNVTQRDFIEQAVRAYCAEPVDKKAEHPKPESDVYRTGMWIDPALVALMDKREVKEGATQRALIERAIRAKLRS